MIRIIILFYFELEYTFRRRETKMRIMRCCVAFVYYYYYYYYYIAAVVQCYSTRVPTYAAASTKDFFSIFVFLFF
jgi:hypothetical protein